MNFPESRRAAPGSHTPELTSTGAAEDIVPMFVAATQTRLNAAHLFFFSCQAQKSSWGKVNEGYGWFRASEN